MWEPGRFCKMRSGPDLYLHRGPVSYTLNSLEGLYIGDYIWDNYRGY